MQVMGDRRALTQAKWELKKEVDIPAIRGHLEEWKAVFDGLEAERKEKEKEEVRAMRNEARADKSALKRRKRGPPGTAANR